MTTNRRLRRGGVALGMVGVAAMLYRLLLRRPILNWGATDAEANARRRATNCSRKLTASRPAQSRSMHQHPPSGRGSRR